MGSVGDIGNDKTLLRRINVKLLHGAILSGEGLSEIVPEVRVLEMPFTFRSYKEFHYVRGKLTPELKNRFSKKGYELIGWVDPGFLYFFSKRVIRSPEDYQESKPWNYQDEPVTQEMFKVFGVKPIPITSVDVRIALQIGMIETVCASAPSVLSRDWFTELKYMTDMPITMGAAGFIIKKRTLAKLSEEHQTILRGVINRHLNELVAKTEMIDVDAIESLKKAGIEIIGLDDEERATFTEVGSEVKSGLGPLIYSQDLLDSAMEALEDYKAGQKGH